MKLFRFSSRSAPPRKRALLFGPASTGAPKIDALLRFASFREAFSDACLIAEGILGWSPGDTATEDASISGAKAFERHFVREVASQVSTFRALTEQGFEFEAVAGISLGELAAAHAAGAQTFEETIRITCAMVKEVVSAGGGDLMGIEASKERARAALGSVEAEVIVDWPEASVWAVPDSSRESIERSLRRARIEYSAMGVECLPHTHKVDQRRFEKSIEGIAPRAPVVPLYSCVTGGRVLGDIDADFWGRMCSEPAQFRAMHAALREDRLTDFIHVGSVAVERVMFASFPPRERPRFKSAEGVLAGGRS